MSYLHELAEAERNGDNQERRHDEWAALREKIDAELDNLPPYMQVVFLRAFRIGFQQASAMAIPRGTDEK